jgi:hypothetical protein
MLNFSSWYYSMLEIQPALLTKSEIEWLLGNKEVSKLYERKIRCSIKKKIETLTELEIPLLVNKGSTLQPMVTALLLMVTLLG